MPIPIPELMQRVLQGVEVVSGPPPPEIVCSVGEDAAMQYVLHSLQHWTGQTEL